MYTALLKENDTDVAFKLTLSGLIYSLYEIVLNSIEGDTHDRMIVVRGFADSIIDNFEKFCRDAALNEEE